ncbi:leukocyte antigen CD37 [Neoarius graeffei]|uniref:leukocyte antigen CD37 n=1 Tax=Neoarius graeffei TaxID=443677 RepID=UPI00298C4BCD|nr:leukocyte antigen CD37 [Neoarius graeffei]
MASEFCLSITKYFLFLFNLIFFLLGLSILGLGVWIACSETIPTPRYLSLSLLSYLLVISGSVTVLLGFFGSLGALKEVKCMLAIYFILLTVLLAAQIIGTVLLFTQKSALVSSVEKHVLDIIKSFEKNDSSLQHFHTSLEFVQREAQCCGWNGKDDWDNIPSSCYYKNATVNGTVQISNFCLHTISNNTCGVYEQNCGEIIKNWINEHLMIILGVVLALAVVEICGTILSMCLYSQASMDYSMPF